jgi:hypothetical protein
MTDTGVLEELTPEAARAEIDGMRNDATHPLNDAGHLKHLDAVERMRGLLGAIDDTPAEWVDDRGVHATADLESVMASAMVVPDDASGYTFDSYSVPEGAEWSDEDEAAFREIFHTAELSQPEVDQLLMISSTGDRPDLDRTMTALRARYGADKKLFEADLAIARAEVRRVGGQGLVDFLDTTGLGNSLQLFDMALRKGRAKEEGIDGGR